MYFLDFKKTCMYLKKKKKSFIVNIVEGVLNGVWVISTFYSREKHCKKIKNKTLENNNNKKKVNNTDKISC